MVSAQAWSMELDTPNRTPSPGPGAYAPSPGPSSYAPSPVPGQSIQNQKNLVLISAGVKPRKLIGPKGGRARQYWDGFGCRTERFGRSDYNQVDRIEPVMVTPNHGRPSDGPTYSVVEDRETGAQAGYRVLSRHPSKHSRRGAAGFASQAVEKKTALNFRTNHAWFGSTIVPSENHELRAKELQKLSQRQSTETPGPFESNIYKPTMQLNGTRPKQYVSLGKPKREENFFVEQQILTTTSQGTSFPKAPRGLGANDLPCSSTPEPGDYQATRHRAWRPKDKPSFVAKACGGETGISESKRGQYAHLATGRDNRTPVPQVRSPSISYAMMKGHDWRALLKMQQPKQSPAYIGPHKLNQTPHRLPKGPKPADRRRGRIRLHEHFVSKLQRSTSPAAREPTPMADRPDTVMSAYGRLQTSPGEHRHSPQARRFNYTTYQPPARASTPPGTEPVHLDSPAGSSRSAGRMISSLESALDTMQPVDLSDAPEMHGARPPIRQFAGERPGSVQDSSPHGYAIIEEGDEEDEDDYLYLEQMGEAGSGSFSGRDVSNTQHTILDQRVALPHNLAPKYEGGRPVTQSDFSGNMHMHQLSPVVSEVEVGRMEAFTAAGMAKAVNQRQLEWRLRNLAGPGPDSKMGLQFA